MGGGGIKYNSFTKNSNGNDIWLHTANAPDHERLQVRIRMYARERGFEGSEELLTEPVPLRFVPEKMRLQLELRAVTESNW